MRLARTKLDELGPMNASEKWVLALIIAATLLWATDSIHGLPSAAIGLGIGLLGFVPHIGNLGQEDLSKINFSIVIFIGAAISMGTVLSGTEVFPRLADVTFSWMKGLTGSENILFLALYALANVFHLFLGNEPALLSTTVPLVMDFSLEMGLNPEALGMAWTFAAGGKLFIYQSAVLALGYSYGAFSAKDLFKLGLILMAVEAFCVTIIVPGYWSLIGIPI